MQTREEKVLYMQQYRKDHREQLNAYDRNYRKDHREKSRERSRKGNKKYRLLHPEAAKISKDKYIRNNIEKHLLSKAKIRARENDLDFNINTSDIQVPKYCPHCQKEFQIGTRQNKDLSPSVDRVDSTKGYIIGNVIVVCWRANSLKKDATLEELRQLVDFYSRLEKEHVR